MSSSDHRAPLSDSQLRVKALEAIFKQKGLVDQVSLDAIIDNYENKVGPHFGAELVARAWTEPEFKEKFLADAEATIAEAGMGGIEGTHIVVKENTPEIHNLVVCTLCSCYPWSLLGLPPTWYKSTPYRAKAVRDPRALLKEFGLSISDDVEVRVWDSTAEIRYLVLPMRPEGTENMSADELAGLINRNSMIGTNIASSVQ